MVTRVGFYTFGSNLWYRGISVWELANISAKNRPFENVLLFFPDTSESQKSEQFNQQEFYEKCDVNTDQLVVENKDVKNATEDTVYTLSDINDDTTSSGEESTSNESSSNSSC